MMSSNNPPEQAALIQLASEVLDSPTLLRQLSDRVYGLLLTELHYQRDRSGSLRRRLP
ncbi:hypothetical protein [Oscillatoria sp. CS-180]|uniref:hypothetical protein n=1 Tax=Oscillatoria sp. CS-180 TaxID=3021720 RepID=UPI00232B8BB0|nr:hypothetical protein [Oscillatoria sp. CS-180]